MKEKHLDTPSEANRDKHINFLEAEEKTTVENLSDDERFGSTKEDEQRRRQWQEGLEEAENARNKNSE